MNKMTEMLDEPGDEIDVDLPGITADIGEEIHRPDMDLGQSSEFRLPPFMRLEASAIQAWNWWYGSPKAALRAVENLKGVRTQEALTVLKRYRRANQMSLLTLIVAHPMIGQCFFPHLPAAQKDQTMPESRLLSMLPTILGQHHDPFEQAVNHLDSARTASVIEMAWPFMADIHDHGGFAPGLSTLLVGAAMLKERLIKDKLTNQERNKLLLATNMLLRAMPPRLAGLVAIHSPEFNDAYTHTYMVYGVTVNTLDQSRGFWRQAGEQALLDTVSYLSRGGVPQPSPFGAIFDEVLNLEGPIVTAACLPRRIRGLYERFCKQASTRYDRLRDSINLYSRSLDVPFAEKDFPADLIGRSLDDAALAQCSEMNLQLLELIVAECRVGGIEEFISSAKARMVGIHKAHDRIAELNSTPSISNMIEIAKLAEETRLQILSHRDWFAEQVVAARAYVDAWQCFYTQVEKLAPQPEKEMVAEPKPPAKTSRAETRRTEQETQVALQASKKAQLAAEKQLAVVTEQLREANTELYTLRTANNERPRDSIAIPGEVAALAIKLALRSNLNPTDVLEFFAATVPDRVVILESAFTTAAAYKSGFDGVLRMLDLMHKLVFNYLDAITSGLADTQARTVFGSKAYSAKESETTLSDTRLRAMREFRYQGEKRLFIRHLRVSNSTGLEGMRIYFDIIDGRVVIAYVGPHLEVGRSC